MNDGDLARTLAELDAQLGRSASSDDRPEPPPIPSLLQGLLAGMTLAAAVSRQA